MRAEQTRGRGVDPATIHDVMDTSLVRATRALRTHAPGLAGVAVRELGRGLDNVAFVAADLVLRVVKGRSVRREAGLLTAVAPRVPIPIPVPRFFDEATGVLGYSLLPGHPLLGRSPAAGMAAAVGRFLHELHTIDPAAVAGLVDVDDADPAAWLEDLDGPPDLLDVLRSTVPPQSPLRVLAHADLGAEHLLDDGTAVTGVIDWSDAALTDPALDFARLYRDFGPAFLEEALHAYGPLDHARSRIEFFARCTALEDLAYGRKSGRKEYADSAQRSLGWLFP